MTYLSPGLARLAQLETAHLKRMNAKSLRAYAGQHSVEHEWVQKMHDHAKELEFEAKILEK